MPRSPKKLPLFLSSKEVDVFLKNVKRDRHLLGFYLMSHAGLRVSEMCGLKVADVNLARGFMKITGKGSKERIVPLTSKLQSNIEQYLSKYGHNLSPQSYLVGLNRRTWHDMVKKYSVRNLGRRDIHCHTLRHSFATTLYEQGVQIERISQLLGHAKLDTTMIYAHISLEQKRDAVMVLDGSRFRFLKRVSVLRRRRSEITVQNYSSLVGREHEIRELNNYLKKGVSVILHGPRGCGKSAILRYIDAVDNTPVFIDEFRKKQTLIKIILASQNIDGPDVYKNAEKELRKLSIEQLLEEIKDIKRIIVIDDITELSRSDRKIVARLAEKAVVAASTSRLSDRKLFKTYLEIKPLKRHHTRIILSEMIQMNDQAKKERIVDDILHTAGDNIKEAEYIANQLQLGKTTEEITTQEREQNQVSIAPFLLVMMLFFVAYVLKSYATSLVAFSYALLVVFRLIFYKYFFTPTASHRKKT
jgi:hypothetical protein